MHEQLTSNRFDFDATVDAIALLKKSQHDVAGGPHTPWAMLQHALDRLERELRVYFVPAEVSL